MQYIKRNPSTQERFGQAFANAGQAVGKAIPEYLQGKQEAKAMKDFGADLRKKHPQNPMIQSIADVYESNLSAEDKKSVATTLAGFDPFKMEQQERLMREHIRKEFNDRIKENDSFLKQSKSYSAIEGQPSERDIALKQRAQIMKERAEAFSKYKIKSYGEEEEEPSFDDEAIEEEQEKPMFDPNNKEHRTKAEQLYKKLKDKERVRKELSKEFKF